MAMQPLSVTLTFRPMMDGLNRFVAGIQDRMKHVEAFNLRLSEGARQTNQLLATAATAFSGAKLVQSFNQVINGGVQFNAELEQARLGIAAVVKQFDTAGKFKTFDEAIRASASAIDLLKQKAVESPSSFSSLVQAFQGTVGPMTAANIKLKDQVNLIVNMSQALAGLGIREEQILQETRALITGNINADAAAAKILAITAADIARAKEQGKLYEFLTSKIAAFAEAGARGATTLTTLKSNFGDALQQRSADATVRLTDALKGFYTQATAFVQSPAFTTVLGLIADKLGAIVDVAASVVGAFQDLGPVAQILLALASTTGNWLLALIAIVAPLMAIRGVFSTLPSLITPVRQAFVFLSKVDFVDALRDLQAFSKELGIVQTWNVANWAQRFAGALAIVSAGLIALQVGQAIVGGLENAALQRLEAEDKVAAALAKQTKQLNEQVASMKEAADQAKARVEIGNALAVNEARIAELQRKKAISDAAVRKGDANPFAPASAQSGRLISTADQKELDDLLFNVDMQRRKLALVHNEAWSAGRIAGNVVKEAGQQAQKQLDALVAKLGEIRATRAEQNLSALAPADRARELSRQRASLQASLDGKPAGLTGDDKRDNEILAERNDLQNRIFAISEQINAAQRELSAEVERTLRAGEEREKFQLETQAMQAELAGNSALAQQIREQIAAKQYANELDQKAPELVQARIEAERELAAQQQRQAQAERTLSEQLGGIALQRALIESDRYTTNEEKQRKLLPLLQEEGRLLRERIALLEQELLLGATDERRGQIQQQLDGLRGQRATNAGDQANAQPQDVSQAVLAATVQMQDQIGTAAEQTARLWSQTGESIRSSLGSAFADAILVGGSFAERVTGFATAVGQAFIQNGAQMLADWVYQHTVMSAVKSAFETTSTAATAAGASARAGVRTTEAVHDAAMVGTQVGVHAAGEGAKTGATLMGAVGRKAIMLGETLFHGVQWVFRTAVHLAGEVANTTVTLAQKAIRMPAVIAESAVYLGQAAIKAMSAVASIPYVGPFLAIAALGAILAAGSKLVKGFETGGIVDGGEQMIRVNENGTEAVLNARATRMLGAGFINRANSGAIDVGSLPGNILQGMAALPANVSAGIAQPGLVDGTGGAAATAATAAAPAAGSPNVNVAVFMDESAAMRWLDTRTGKKVLYRKLGNDRAQLGQET